MQHLFVAEPEDPVATCLQSGGSGRIPRRLMWRVMDSAVQFDAELSCGTVEIDDEVQHRVLTPEAQAADPLTPE